MGEWNIEYWLTDSEINQLEYSRYWNDEEREKEKEWYVLDGNFSKMEDYLQRIGLPRDLAQCVNLLKVGFKRELGGAGIDLAAGSLWAAPYLFKLGQIDKLYCLEYSKHRLVKIGPKVLERYNISQERIALVLGSFYDLHLRDSSLDFVLLSQAFHHADNPDKLLSEIRRVLKPNGAVLIIGEHVVSYWKLYLKHAVAFIISTFVPSKVQQKFFGKTFQVRTPIAKPAEIFSVDPILGDHYYTVREYLKFFSDYGFKIKRIRNHRSQFQSFVLVRNEI
jgi:ubiquinone/menaquinone biosynthesis C-methylase UbiE